MKRTVKIAGLKQNDLCRRIILDKKVELQKFCNEYENILKEQLPQYGIDGILPAVQIVPDRKTMEAGKGFFKMVLSGIFENQPPFAWAVKKGACPCKKVLYKDSKVLYVCSLPKEFPADKWEILSKNIGDFYRRWTDGCDVRPGLIYQLSGK